MLVQFFVKLFDRSLSVQKVLCDTSVKELIESSCQKLEIKTPEDFYGVISGITLENEDFLSCYPIHRDSTVELRLRMLGGQPVTYAAKFSKAESELFEHVALSSRLVNNSLKDRNWNIVTSVLKLTAYSRFNLKEVLIYFTGQHRNHLCYYGAFGVNDILFENGRVCLRAGIPNRRFDEAGCRLDYMALHNIFRTLRTADGYYSQDFEHLLNYLKDCPAGALSRSEPAIRFLINHPALEFYMDRMKQVMLLDNLLFRGTNKNDVKTIKAAMGGQAFWNWWTILENCPEMVKVLYHDSVMLPCGSYLYNPLYTEDMKGCIHYANNYFKHGRNKLDLVALEAAFSINVPDMLVEVLQNITLYAIDPRNTGFENKFADFLKLIGNDLADSHSGD